MANIASITGKLQGNALQPVKLYKQDASVDIDTMLNGILDEMWNDITNKSLAPDELDTCKQVFAQAVITNLVDKQAQADLDTLFSNTLASYAPGKFDNVYLSQMLRACKMPEPSAKCVYVVGDVTDAAKAYDTNKDDASRKALLASLGAFYSNANAMFVLMDDQQAMASFTSLANSMLKPAGAQEIPANYTIDNKVFDGLILRIDYKLCAAENNPNSEARIISSLLTTAYTDWVLPSRTVEAFLPSTIIFFNAKKLARATSTELLGAKSDIGKLATLDKSRIIGFNKMASLQTIAKAVNKQQTMMNQLNNALAQSGRANTVGKFVIKNIDMNRIKRKLLTIEKKMKAADISKNPTYHNFDTFQRPNRRSPENPDLPGTSMDLSYYPDIHIYQDTSGSISVSDYEDAVAMIIDIAKKLNCDVYFNSFTTDISQEAVVRCRDRSKAQIQKDILNIPKLEGGTTIDQVWSYINATRKNRRQLSILISDFYVDIPRYIKHPANLYYIPIKGVSAKYAEAFAKRLPNPWRVLF